MPFKNKEQQTKYNKNYYQTHKEKLKGITQNYYWSHKKEVSIHNKIHYLNNTEKTLERNKLWQSTHRQQVNIYLKKYYINQRTQIFTLLGNKCSNPKCLVIGGCTDVRCLQVDHVNGGGVKERKSFTSQYAYYKFVLNQIKAGSKDYQLLCANCNQIKRIENKEN
jgi:hypothetical protein